MILNPTYHARLMADMARVTEVAGVQRKYIEEGMGSYCGPEEIDWVVHFAKYRRQGLPGLLLLKVPNPEQHCQAIAGALLRNYIDARVVPLNQLLDWQQDEERPKPTVLCVPNLYVNSLGTGLASYRIQVMYDALLQRTVLGKPSVLCVENMEGLAKAYGTPFSQFLNSFKKVVA